MQKNDRWQDQPGCLGDVWGKFGRAATLLEYRLSRAFLSAHAPQGLNLDCFVLSIATSDVVFQNPMQRFEGRPLLSPPSYGRRKKITLHRWDSFVEGEMFDVSFLSALCEGYSSVS